MVNRLLTPTGVFPQASMVAHLLADTAKFQEVVKATDYDSALAKVYEFEAQDKLDECPPRAIVMPHGLGISSTARKTFSPEGAVLLSIDIPTPEAYRKRGRTNQSIWFMNTIGVIADQMACLSGEPGTTKAPITGQSHIEIGRIQIFDGPDIILPGQRQITDPDRSEALDSFWFITLEVEVL